VTVTTRLWRAGLVLLVICVLAFGAVAPPERCPTVTTTELIDSSQATVDWFVRNQDDDGSWLYLYNADEDSSAAEYNEVRHAGVTMGLYQAAAAGLPGALESADRGTEWALERLVEREDWAALEYGNEVNVGSTALFAAGLSLRKEATGDPRYDDLLRRLGRFLQSQTESSGAVLASYDMDTGAPVPDLYSKYYTGEAYWALARLHLDFPGEGWDETANRIGNYLATSRDETEDHWPPIPDHWAAYGAAETLKFPERSEDLLTEDEADYARDQAELFGPQARWIAQRFGPWGELVRGTYTPRGGGYGVTSEALTGWWLAARAEPELADLQEPIAERSICMASLAIEAQADAGDAADATDPDRVEGAWFLDGETRMDDQQHALAGLLRTIPIVEAEEEGSGEGGVDTPPAWLWLFVLFLLLNPARAAFAVPRVGRPPRELVRLAAVGGTIGGLAVCAAAAIADPLLDLLDVSDPSFRVAAGLIALLTGAIDLFRKPPARDPALEGRAAALVPVAFPVVARPALLVVAVGAGADQGVLLSAGAMALGIAGLTGLVAADLRLGLGGRTLRWVVRLLAIALIACGILLTLDGVMSV
jgi:small neutral amino acid transporter SnatA (MarC family)